MHDSSPDVNSPLPFQLYGNGKMGLDMPSKGTQNQLLERQVSSSLLYSLQKSVLFGLNMFILD